MFRSSRARASLIRSLLLGTATTAFAVTASSVLLVGCKDESQPDYWVEKLNEDSWRARAVTRLGQFYEDASSKAKGDNSTPEVQALLNKIVEPLTKTYVEKYDKMDGKTRVALIKLLASVRDKRTEPALKKAFEEFAKKPATSKNDADIKWAVRASANIVEKMVEGSVQKYLKEVTLLGQPFVKDDKQTIEQLLKSKGAQVARFVLYVVGEGIEKKTSDFAAEVAAQAAAAAR